MDDWGWEQLQPWLAAQPRTRPSLGRVGASEFRCSCSPVPPIAGGDPRPYARTSRPVESRHERSRPYGPTRADRAPGAAACR
jgi:hypothetical protein